MIFSAFLLLAATADDPSIDCDNQRYQVEMNYCAGKDYEVADFALNAQWKLTAATMRINGSKTVWPALTNIIYGQNQISETAKAFSSKGRSIRKNRQRCMLSASGLKAHIEFPHGGSRLN